MIENKNVFDVFDNFDTSEEYIDSDKDPEYEPNGKKIASRPRSRI